MTVMDVLREGPASKETNRQAWDFLVRFKGVTTLAIDTETNGEDVRDGRGFCMGVSIAARIDGDLIGYYFPFRHITGGNLDRSVLSLLKEVVESAVTLVFHNAKFDIVSL